MKKLLFVKKNILAQCLYFFNLSILSQIYVHISTHDFPKRLISWRDSNPQFLRRMRCRLRHADRAKLHVSFFFVANTFQIQPFHKGLAIWAVVAFCFMPGA
jgi:hypothetical protein